MEEPNLRLLVCLFKLCLETKNTVGNILIGVLNEPWRWNSIFPMVFHFLKNTILSLTSKWGYVMGSRINYWKLYQPVVLNHIEDQTHHLAPKSYFLDLTSTLNHAEFSLANGLLANGLFGMIGNYFQRRACPTNKKNCGSNFNWNFY